MAKNVRKKAVELMADLPWGAHCCHFYGSKKDLLDVLVPYFRVGLLNNEFCVWITSKPSDVNDALRGMRKALPNFDSYLDKQQIEILSYGQWYVKKSSFDPRRVLRGWIEKCNQASANGYSGMRLTGSTLWLERTLWKKFADYEEELDKIIGRYRIKAVCTYSLGVCRGHDIIDVVKNHGYALVKRGTWELIENSQRRRAEEQALEKAMAKLEKIVEQRTAELQDANRKLTLEIAERKRAEDALRTSREQLRGLAGYLQSVREEERTRIARELHDEIGQVLTGIKFALETATRGEAGSAKPGLAQALALANDLIARVRDLSLELRPAMLDDLGLLAALRWHFDRYAAQFDIKVDFEFAGLEGRRFAGQIETAAYRIVQEALTNVARHAGVDRVEVDLRADEGVIRIRIKDRGAGFDAHSLSDRATGGLSGMRERAIALGGRLKIEATPGAGTFLTAELPLRTGISGDQQRLAAPES